MILLCIVPRLKESVTDSKGRCLVRCEVIEIEPGAGERVLNVVGDLSLDGLFVGAEVRAHQLPHLFISLLLLVVLEFRL